MQMVRTPSTHSMKGCGLPIAEVSRNLVARRYRCDLVRSDRRRTAAAGRRLSADGCDARSGRDRDDRNFGRGIDVSRLDPRVIKIMDLKCPGSGECERNLWSNLDHLTMRDEINVRRRRSRRLRMGARRDRCARPGASRRRAIAEPGVRTTRSAALAAWIPEDRLPVRMQLQMHKQIWPGIPRGV